MLIFLASWLNALIYPITAPCSCLYVQFCCLCYFNFWAMCECQGDSDRTNKSMPGEFSLGVWEGSSEQMSGLEVVAKSSKSGNNSSLLL